MPTTQENISNRVHEIRKGKGLTQKDLADKVKVSRQTIISIEKGNYIPSVLLALKIGLYFKTPVEDIFFITK